MFTQRGGLQVLLGSVLAGSLALLGCGGRAADDSGMSAGCSEALAARGEALASMTASAKVAAEKSAARAAQLRAIADEAGAELARVVDLGPCEDDTDATGLVIDLTDLRARYSVVLERTQARLDQTSAQPVVAPADSGRGKGKGKEGKKDDD